LRPLRIRIEGFSVYRATVEVDFTGAEFFSLAGPTGSGKSSLVDAMIFALFGRVPRLGGNAVAPAITAGADRARVRFDFEVNGVAYAAVRMAQRIPTGGASVKEARLQEGDAVLAAGADDVTAAIEELLRLRFDDFTRTVVLPQGDFARFLTATKAERQGLLRNLLGFEVYNRVRELAKTRSAVAAERADGAQRTLESLDVPDEETARAAIERRDSLITLSETIAEREKELLGLEQAVERARMDQARLVDAIDRLNDIEVPDQLEQLDALLVEARSRLVEAEEAHAVTVEALGTTEAAITGLPSRDQLAAIKKARSRVRSLEERMASLNVDGAKARLDEAMADLSHSSSRLQTAREDLAAARLEHSAHTLAATLEPGRPCPVCSREVTESPVLGELGEISELEGAETRIAGEVEQLRRSADEARSGLAGIEAARIELDEQRETLARELAGAPDDDELSRSEARLAELQGVLSTLGDELETRAAVAERARRDLEALSDASRQVSRRLTAAQLKVADLEPPVSESDDPLVQWKELFLWRGEKLDILVAQRIESQEKLDVAAATAGEARQRLIAILSSHGLETQEPFAVSAATALQAARSTVEVHEKAVRDAAVLEQQIETASRTAAVAQALAAHLRATGFERWLMAGALTDLVDGANDLLSQLSEGGYSLHSDDSGSFSIVDHRNADEMRSVSTLSGGETFLVSLALALSLAETLASKGGAGLDAIILDEGFGSLDEESLDTVAAVLEELAGRGLMVGVITHVKELAARAPVRFEVTREAAGAQVRLVS
jgi:exonuclease SbcC